jgi:hypothetical protein
MPRVEFEQGAEQFSASGLRVVEIEGHRSAGQRHHSRPPVRLPHTLDCIRRILSG